MEQEGISWTEPLGERFAFGGEGLSFPKGFGRRFLHFWLPQFHECFLTGFWSSRCPARCLGLGFLEKMLRELDEPLAVPVGTRREGDP